MSIFSWEGYQPIRKTPKTKNLIEYPRASKIDKEWENIKIAIKRAANKAIGKKKKNIEESKV
jgi:hypothetical protein